jgi:hypothetical protein
MDTFGLVDPTEAECWDFDNSITSEFAPPRVFTSEDRELVEAFGIDYVSTHHHCDSLKFQTFILMVTIVLDSTSGRQHTSIVGFS